jgi:hypothetical protein
MTGTTDSAQTTADTLSRIIAAHARRRAQESALDKTASDPGADTTQLDQERAALWRQDRDDLSALIFALAHLTNPLVDLPAGAKVEDGEDALSRFLASGPEAILYFSNLDEPDEEEGGSWDEETLKVSMVCPHPGCTSHTFYDLDLALRWNAIHEPTLDGGTVYYAVDEGDRHFEDQNAMRCGGCGRPVSYPEGVETVW